MLYASVKIINKCNYIINIYLLINIFYTRLRCTRHVIKCICMTHGASMSPIIHVWQMTSYLLIEIQLCTVYRWSNHIYSLKINLGSWVDIIYWYSYLSLANHLTFLTLVANYDVYVYFRFYNVFSVCVFYICEKKWFWKHHRQTRGKGDFSYYYFFLLNLSPVTKAILAVFRGYELW